MSSPAELNKASQVSPAVSGIAVKGMVWSILSGLLAILIAVVGCGTDRTVASGRGGGVQISDDVFSIDEHPEVSLISIEGSVYTFTFTGSSPDLVNGDFIVGSAGAGYLREVAAVDRLGDSLVVDTKRASLTDAIINGSMEHTVRIDPRFTTPADRSAVCRKPGHLQMASGATLVSGGIDLSGLTLISGSVDGVDVNVTITDGLIDFKPNLALGLTIQSRDLDEVSAIMSGDLRFDCTIEAYASAKTDCSAETTVLSVTDTLIQFIGTVPVVEIVQLDFIAGCEVIAGGNAACKFGCESDFDVTVGAEYKRGQWSEIWERSSDLSGDPIIRAGSVDLDVQVYIRPRLEIIFYGASKSVIECGPFVAASYGLSDSVSCRWELSAGISGALGFGIDILGYNIETFDKDLPEYREVLRTGDETCECTWKKSVDESPVLDVGESGAHDASQACVCSVVKVGSQYFMYYYGSPDRAGTTDHKYIMLAVSTDGLNWTKHGNGDEPLDFGITGYHEIMGISILYDQNESPPFKAWYARAVESGYSPMDIFYATSYDGIAWDTETIEGPVVARGTGWEDFRVVWPCVRLDAGVYHMWYEGSTEYSGGGIGHAISTDGVHWAKDTANPVISPESNAPWVVLVEDTYYLYLGSPSGILRATSEDGSLWDKSGFEVPVLTPGTPGSWDAISIRRLVAMEDDGLLRGWYSGGDGSVQRSGHATCEMP